jgi:hypothetical protein
MFRRLHNTARVFRNAVAKEVEAIERAKGDDLEFGDEADLVAGKRGREAEVSGWVGRWVGGWVGRWVGGYCTVRKERRKERGCWLTKQRRLGNERDDLV